MQLRYKKQLSEETFEWLTTNVTPVVYSFPASHRTQLIRMLGVVNVSPFPINVHFFRSAKVNHPAIGIKTGGL